MKSTHLTDEMLQAFLLKEIANDSIDKHLTECSVCRAKLESYQYLIGSMQKITPETFSFDVTTIVMNNISLYEKKKSKKQELTFWGILIFLLIAISSFSIPFIPNILEVFYLKSIIPTQLLLGTGVVVLLFLWIDIIQQYKKKEKKIFNNNLQPIL